jgi:hypothetical protein
MSLPQTDFKLTTGAENFLANYENTVIVLSWQTLLDSVCTISDIDYSKKSIITRELYVLVPSQAS